MTEEELSAAYEAYGPAVYRRCRKILGNDSEALDTTQEVFLRALKHRRGLRAGRELLGWCYRVGTRLCLTRLQDRLRRGEAALVDIAHQAASPEERTQARELAATILSGCDARTREIAIYTLVDGMTQEEASALAGITTRTVRNHLSRFSAHVRRQIAAWHSKEVT